MNRPHSKIAFRFSVGVVAGLGFLGMAGWLGDVSAFRGVTSEWATMKPITCLLFIISALALWCFQKSGPGIRVAQALAVVLVIFGLLSVQGTLNVDRWLLTLFGGNGAYAMSPNTSLCFLMSGLALFASPMNSALRFLTQPLAALVAMTALVAMCGYLVGAESLYTVSGFGSMAFNTSVAFGGLAMGTFATQPRFGLMRVWGQENASGATLRRLLPVVAGLPLFLGWVAHHGVLAKHYNGDFGLALTVSACSALIGFYAVWSASQQGAVEESLIQQKANERFVLSLAEEVQGFSQIEGLVAHVCNAMTQRLGLDACELVTSGPFPTALQTHQISPDAPLKPVGALAFAIVPTPIAQPAAALVLSTKHQRRWSTEDLRFLADAAETLWLLRERCAAATALHASEHDLTLTMNSITDGIITTDEAGRVKRLNPMASRLLGISESELIGAPLGTVFHLDDLKIPGEIGDHEVVNSQGHSRHIRGRISIVEGGTFGMVVVFRDVEEEHVAQVLIKESEARKSAILRSAFDPIVSMNHEGNIVEFNEAAERVFGYTRAEVMGRQLADVLIPARLRGAHSDGLARFLSTGTTEILGGIVEMPSMHCEGTEIPTEIAIVQVPGQEPPIFTAIIRDLRIRRQADEQFKVAMESAPVGMIMVDNLGQIALVNQRAEAIFGYTRVELLGSPIEMLIPKRYAPQHPANRAMFHFNPVARAMGERRDIYGARKDGMEVPLEIALNPVQTVDGQYVLCSVEDITTRKRQEDERVAMVSQLRSLNAELGRGLGEREVLLQEVHHRVKNNLQVISSLMSIQARSVEDANAAAALVECRTRVEAIALIHEKLYQSKDYAEVPFDIYVAELVENISEAIGSRLVSMIVEVEDFPLSVNKAIPCGLIINELVTNAMRHAFQPGVCGEIKVSMKQIPDRRVELVVADNGVGMDADAARPNSLGLHLVSTLVRQLRGDLDKTTNAGTQFSVTFPAHDEEQV